MLFFPFVFRSAFTLYVVMLCMSISTFCICCAEKGRRRGADLGPWITSVDKYFRRRWTVDKSRRLRGSKIGAGSRFSVWDRCVLVQGG